MLSLKVYDICDDCNVWLNQSNLFLEAKGKDLSELLSYLKMNAPAINMTRKAAPNMYSVGMSEPLISSSTIFFVSRRIIACKSNSLLDLKLSFWLPWEPFLPWVMCDLRIASGTLVSSSMTCYLTFAILLDKLVSSEKILSVSLSKL